LLAVKAQQKALQEHQTMTTLFPTFTSIWQRAKRFLATDTREIWERIEATLEADEARYQQELEAKGHADFYPGLYW
jgi:hypothetical protein